MSLTTEITIIALDENGKECFRYKAAGGYGDLAEILSGEAKMIKEGLLGMLTEEEIEYYKFENPWTDEEEWDDKRIKIKDPKKLLNIFNKIKEHYIQYELKEWYKKDIERNNDNWMLSYIRSKVNVLVELGKMIGILELAAQNNCKIKAFMPVW